MLDTAVDERYTVMMPSECKLKLVMDVPGGWVEYYPPTSAWPDRCVLNELDTHTQLVLANAVKQFAIGLLVRYGRWN